MSTSHRGLLMTRKIQTTLRIPDKVHNRFKELVASQKRDMNEVLQELMTRWTEDHTVGDRAQMDQAVGLLVNAVCEQLKDNSQWATEALMRAGLGLPGSNVFDQRIGHF